jgi:hypothetical protein
LTTVIHAGGKEGKKLLYMLGDPKEIRLPEKLKFCPSEMDFLTL